MSDKSGKRKKDKSVMDRSEKNKSEKGKSKKSKSKSKTDRRTATEMPFLMDNEFSLADLSHPDFMSSMTMSSGIPASFFADETESFIEDVMDPKPVGLIHGHEGRDNIEPLSLPPLDHIKRMEKARQRLMRRLGGDQRSSYYNNLKDYFRRKTTREEFVEDTHLNLDEREVDMSNNFMGAVLDRIASTGAPFEDLSEKGARRRVKNNMGTTYGKKAPRKEPRGLELDEPCLEDDVVTHRVNKEMKVDGVVFHPADLYSYAPNEDFPASGLLCLDPSLAQPRKAVHELFLPDPGSIMGRLLVAAWEQELIIIDDDVRDYIVMGVQVLLKNILSACIRMRKTYRRTGSGQFFYDVGWPDESTYLRNSAQHVNYHESLIQKYAKRVHPFQYPAIAHEETNKPIKMQHLWATMKNANLVPAHSVRSIAQERISARLPTQ